jgi:hypothetical protein
MRMKTVYYDIIKMMYVVGCPEEAVDGGEGDNKNYLLIS